MATLIEKVRVRIAAGALPASPAPKLFVGPGDGARCAGCDFPITNIKYEFDALGERVIRMHRECYQVWKVERTKTVQPN